MKKEMEFISFDGTKLFMVKNEVEHPIGVFVIVHGLCEHLGRYDYVTQKLNDHGFCVYRFDHRGHGRSEGRRVYYNKYTQISDDVNAVTEMAAKENTGLPLFVIGHSMGGYATASFATRYPGKARGIILSGALTRYNHKLAGDLPMTIPEDTYLPNNLGNGVCSDPEVIEAYDKDPLVEKEISVALFNSLGEGVTWLSQNGTSFTDPVLILHGCCDGLVSEKDSRDFFGDIASKDKTLKIYANLCHEILNEPCKDEIIAEILSWTAKHM